MRVNVYRNDPNNRHAFIGEINQIQCVMSPRRGRGNPGNYTSELQSQETADQSMSADLSQTQCDIFNTTYSLYRVSPLFLGSGPLSDEYLQLIGHRLRDRLVGDIVRGVEVGLDVAGIMSSAGSLETVAVEWVSTDLILGTPQQALQVALQYESAVCSAVLLPTPESGAYVNASSHFLHLPLLLFRMPTPIKAIVVSFFSSTFDCRITPLRLTSHDLVRNWEIWAMRTALPTTGTLAKDVVVTLEFRLPGSKRRTPVVADDDTGSDDSADTLGLRAVDIIVPNEDLPHFLKAGQGPQSVPGDPFTAALTRYVKHHLAMDMSNPAVGVARISCGGFVLGKGRIKIFSSPDTSMGGAEHQVAIRHMLKDLVARAKGAS